MWDAQINPDLHENSFYIYLDINQWEKIVAVEIREQSKNMTRTTRTPIHPPSTRPGKYTFRYIYLEGQMQYAI